jgi:membrane-bound lytic murein transglycosylase B
MPVIADATDSFATFLGGVRAEARRQGISEGTLDRALTGLRPNQKVIELDHYQPEFTMTWSHYRETRLSDTRIANGRAAFVQNRATLQAVSTRFGVSPAVIVGIWGLETNYGTFLGGFNVVEALATLAWEGRRASYFRTELIAALKILDHGDVSFSHMIGSYAGAMGQPQFMPTSFFKLAVDFEGDGRRDIWDSKPDALASIANYLAKSGWRDGEGWGEQVRVPSGFDTGLAGRDNRRPLAEWARLGVARFDGRALPRIEAQAGLVLPDGAGGESFLVYSNFAAIRRYNPSDYYALSVGLLGDLVVA